MNVTVVVPSASPAAVLGRTLSALRRELPDAPLVVVDDRGGRSDVASTVRAHMGQVLTSDGVGPAGARNLGASSADTEWLLFLDDDITVGRKIGPVVFELAGCTALVVVGGLKAPQGAPAWLVESYAHGVMAPTASGRASATRDGTQMSAPLALVRRSAWADAGGFPPIVSWGWEEALFGLRVQRIAGRRDWLVHDPRLTGVHEFVPTWEQWLMRQRKAGEGLPVVLADLPADERDQLLRAVVLAGGARAVVKRALGRLPRVVWRVARGGAWRRVAAAASFAAGYRTAARAH